MATLLHRGRLAGRGELGKPSRQTPAVTPSRRHWLRAVQPSVRQHVQDRATDTEEGQPATLLADKVVLCVGSGVAGMSAAMALAKLGAEVHVFEGRSAPPVGVAPFVVVQSRGAQALAACGVDLSNVPPQMRFNGTVLHQPDGTTQFRMGWGKEVAPMYGCNSAMLTNFVRQRALELYPSIKVHVGRRLVGGDVRQRELEFEDAETGQRAVVSGDLLVGADGGNSALRQLIMDQTSGLSMDASPHPNAFVITLMPNGPGDFDGLGNPLRLFPDDPPANGSGASGKGWAERGHTFAALSCAAPRYGAAASSGLVLSPTGETLLLWSMPVEFWRENHDAASFRATLDECFPQLPPACADELVKVALQPGSLRPLPTSRKCSRIAEPGVVLVGDAAHPVSPHLGQGAQCSLEDGVSLGKAVVEANGDIELACRLYNETRLPEVHALVDMDRLAVASRSQTRTPLQALARAKFGTAMLITQLQWLPGWLRPSSPFAALSTERYTDVKEDLSRKFAGLVALAAFTASTLFVGGWHVVGPLVSN